MRYVIQSENVVGKLCCLKHDLLSICEFSLVIYTIFQVDLGVYIPLEIVLMMKLTNVENSIQIIEYFEDEEEFHVVMERPHNCVTLDKFAGKRGIKEVLAKKLFKQVICVFNI